MKDGRASAAPARGPPRVGRYGSGVSSTACAAPRRSVAKAERGGPPHGRVAANANLAMARVCAADRESLLHYGLAMCQAPFRKPSPLVSPGAVSFLKV